MTTPAGWYPDPSGGPGQRYFDGTQWTESRMPGVGVKATSEPPRAAAKRNNTVGLIALIVSIIGFIFACIPGALIVGWVLLPAAFVLGVVGLFMTGKSKATSIAAVIISIVGTVVGVVVFFAVVSDAFEDAFNESDLSASPGTTDRSTLSPSSPNRSQDENQSGSRQNPFPIGETVSNPDWDITLGTPREAWSEIASENQFNEPPEPGTEFWIVPVIATYKGNETGSTAWEISVKFVGSDNRTYDDYCGVIPDPLVDIGDLYKGGTAQGNVCVAVPAGADGLWSVSTGFGKPVFFQS
ncbi:DUF2510 domain-containing protein [Mycolicibacterium elephantis]|uniref:DUF2510 domain-containing protein n=1 Tax=Mycolicibacterium elephantis TaxID=81858 RepID=UPI000AD2D049|nr:DUF2510 domain-containing protein [Mycolicibacterium elephantis]